MKLYVKASLAALWCLGATAAWAQIYSCVDAKGRKLTSDRPIAECADRDQKELNSNATVKRTVKPTMTAEEQRAFDEKERNFAEEQARTAEEKRKNRALLIRYPSRAAHDKERVETLAQVDDVIKAATKRVGELATQRTAINAELEFYKKDPGKMPMSLKRQIEDNDNSVAVQKRFVVDQEGEKKRINMRFDEELVRLKTLWPLMGAVGTPGTAKK
jgi:mRNA-degrading endonuclease HigB of HigAB toxin-antitoxin module